MGKIDLQSIRTARGIATRARIVEAATDLVRAHGVANTSLDAVLAASNTSKSQLYHYFADKDDLVLAVIQRQTECVLAAQEPLLKKFNSLAGLRRWRDALVELSAQNDGAGGCPLGSLVPEVAESSAKSRALLAAGFKRWEAYLVAGFTAMRARGELKPGAEPADLATAVLTALQGGLLLAQTMRSTRPLELVLDMALQHVVSKSR
jgi:AcrR family transcriptional regulator